MAQALKQVASGDPPQLLGMPARRRHRQGDEVSGGEIDGTSRIGDHESVRDNLHKRGGTLCKISARRPSGGIARHCSTFLAGDGGRRTGARSFFG
jgi:hypothetical protein